MKKTTVGLARQNFQIEGIQISNAEKEGGTFIVDGNKKVSLIEEEPVKLPSGDFVISWSPSGFPIITRTTSAKSQCPDRLNLDKQRLTLCPILEGEGHLRLLNYQHNLISRIENLTNLTKLIFLDLYDNQITIISGLDSLKSLRVLMLGKNKIKRIESLGGLRKLDVLDLHNNQLVKVENLEQLQDLRVLNLAGNLIRRVENLRGLHSLTELNLRRNLIETVKDCEYLSNLKQLYLSYNMIARFEDIANIALCRSLVEIALDGNPLCQGPCYRIATIKQMPQIKQLDLKRITEDERQVANAFKIGNPSPSFIATSAHTDSNRLLMKPNQRLDSPSSSAPTSFRDQQTQPDQPLDASSASNKTISNSNLQQAAAIGTAMPTGNGSVPSPSSTSQQSVSKPTSFKIKIPGGVSITQQLEIFDIDNLFKPSPGNIQSSAQITTISFNRISFSSIVPHLAKLKSFYPSLSVICFNECNIETLVQLVSLSLVKRIQNIVIGYANNPVTNLTYWKVFLAWKTGAHSINGEQLPDSEVAKMEHVFGLMPNPPPQAAMAPKLREYVLKYVQDMRQEASRGVSNSSRLRFFQDQLVGDLLQQIGRLES